MESHKQSTIAHALGWIEDYVEGHTEPIEPPVELKDDEPYLSRVHDDNEHRAQTRHAMTTLANGVKQLMRENTTLISKIALAEMALRG
jgi:hypothetical protein